MIVFGWNSFKLKGYKPSSLGMPAELDQEYTIEKRQKYFHLFWIPFFGIGKTWALRKSSDDKLYEPNPQLLAVLDSLPVIHKTPWYTYSLVILALAAGIIYSISEKVDNYYGEKRHQAYLAEKRENFTNSITNPGPGTYYKMGTSGEDVYLKVLRDENTSLFCLFSTKHERKYSEHEMLEAFIKDSAHTSFDTVSIRKEDMLKTINMTDSYSFNGVEVINGAGSFVLKEIKVNTFPVFKSLGSAYENGEFLAVVQNIGESAKFKELTPETSNLDLESSLFPEELKTGEYFYLKGSYKETEPKMRAKLTFESAAKGIAEYNFNIMGAYLSFKQIN